MDPYTELEDDLFFVHLKRQILLLVMEEEEEDYLEQKPLKVSLNKPDTVLPHQSDCFHSWNHYNESSPPIMKYPSMANTWSWELSPQRESMGTGVFIPKLPQMRKKSRGGRKNHGNQSKQINK